MTAVADACPRVARFPRVIAIAGVLGLAVTFSIARSPTSPGPTCRIADLRAGWDTRDASAWCEGKATSTPETCTRRFIDGSELTGTCVLGRPVGQWSAKGPAATWTLDRDDRGQIVQGTLDRLTAEGRHLTWTIKTEPRADGGSTTTWHWVCPGSELTETRSADRSLKLIAQGVTWHCDLLDTEVVVDDCTRVAGGDTQFLAAGRSARKTWGRFAGAMMAALEAGRACHDVVLPQVPAADATVP